VFFFQAEDGIRDRNVTGVQTCALPILGAQDTSAPYAVSWNTATVSNGPHTLRAIAQDILGVQWVSDPVTVTAFNDTSPPSVTIKIGRASCRESGEVEEVAMAVKRKIV